MSVLFFFVANVLSVGSDPQQTGNWPGFLGAGATQVDPDSLPLVWSDHSNIAWKTNLLGQGQSAPVIWKDRVYTTSIEGIMRDTCHVQAFSLDNGAPLWSHRIPSSTKARSTRTQSRAAPTPAADSEAVYVFFETGDVAAISHAGKELWRRSLVKEVGKFESTIGLAASPLLVGPNVVLLVDHEGPSYLTALSKKDGKTVWKSDRDSRSSYTSPSLIAVGNTRHIVCSSSGSVDGYEPETGKLLWSFDEVGGNNVASPFQAGNGRFLIGAQAGMHNEREKEAKQSNLIMEIVQESDGKFQPKVVWRSPMITSFSNPIFYKGITYWMSKTGNLGAYDSTSGKEVWSTRLKEACWAAPIPVGDRIYFFGKDGLTTIIQAGPTFKVLAENRLWDPALAPPTPPRGSTAGATSTSEGRRPTLPVEGQHSAKTLKENSNEAQGKRPMGDNPDAPGRPIFQDPVQYGVAVVNGNIVIRTGSQLYCVRGRR